MMLSNYCKIGIVSLGLALVAGLPGRAQVEQVTPPAQLILSAPTLITSDASYRFEITLSHYRVVEGIPQLRALVNILKTSENQTAKFKDILLFIAPDASSFEVIADGKKFIVEAAYWEEYDLDNEPREIKSTFGKMFFGGQIGIQVRLKS